MKLTKILMILLLFWMIPASVIPIFDLVIWFPYLTSVVPIDDLASHRLLSVRSAAFMTIAYFIINHLRQKKPLSSVTPVFVYANFLWMFSTIFLIKNGGPITEWFVVIFIAIFSGVLFFANKNESNKIFKDAW
ncbi:MAG: hypothetical protein CBE15_08695 [Euryarchaeota archaeon TMED255]|nr:MAG: hypothetical protein CBE15_08695 [Euryarchaeota archaeon TMED255]